jgi:hypothetical protein
MKKNEIVVAGQSNVPAMFQPAPGVLSVRDIMEGQEEQFPGGKFLPYSFYTNKKNCPTDTPKNRFCFKEDRSTFEVKAPYAVSYILTRQMYRGLEEDSYKTRYYEGYPGIEGKTAKEFAEKFKNYAKDKKSFGFCHLYCLVENIEFDGEKVIKTPKTSVKILTHECCGGATLYFTKLLDASYNAANKERHLAVVTIDDHTPNLIKAESGNYYLAHYRFNQFTVAGIPEDIQKMMKEQFEIDGEKIEEFLKK